MTVMQVGVVPMGVGQRLVPVWMHVRCASYPYVVMLVPMMFVVDVRVIVLHRFVRMFVHVPLSYPSLESLFLTSTPRELR